jgi:hypothetical protein
MVLTVSFVISPAIRLSCHRRSAKKLSAKLDASVETSGPHDLKSSAFFDLLKTTEMPDNKGLFAFYLKKEKACRNPAGPNRP